MKQRPAARGMDAVLFGLLAFFVTATAAQAGQISIKPLGLVLTQNQPIRTFTINNPGDDPVIVQSETLSWRQDNGDDELIPTRELLITPPIVTILPGESQLVRVGLRRAPEPSRELSYRVRFSEVPPPPEPGFTGLAVTLIISVPVFVEPPAPVAAEAHWQARMLENGKLALRVSNRGSAHLKLTEVAVLAQGTEIGRGKMLLYALPGSSGSLNVPVNRFVASGTTVNIEAHMPNEVRTFQVRVE